ncbi:MAG: hypothetical protein FJ087_07940 [Deltaproteobacteria bacterium]|nr:hypothetical protein [Deltaproteobacteria bacterium]
MPRPRKLRVVPGQLSLLEQIAQVDRARSLPVEIKAALAEDLRRSRYPRDQVADRMAALLAREITQAMLDAWTAPSKPEHRFPTEYLPAFVHATEEHRTLRLLADACGCRVFVPELVRRDLVRVEEEQRRLAQRGRVLRVLVEAEDTGVLG